MLKSQPSSSVPNFSSSSSATTTEIPPTLPPTPTAQTTQPKHHRILDVGSGLGQDIRKLLHDGVPGSAITALELDEQFLPFGDALFRDRVDPSPIPSPGTGGETTQKPKSGGIKDVNFLIGDILSLSPSPPTPPPLPDLLGAFSILHLGSLLHLFPLPKQHALLAACVRLASTDVGTTILGWQIGSPSPMDYFDMTNFSLQYRHSVESFGEMWTEVGRETGSEWRVERCEISEGAETKWGEPGYWRLVWEVRRL